MAEKKNEKIRDLSTKKLHEENAEQVKGGKISKGPKPKDR